MLSLADFQSRLAGNRKFSLPQVCSLMWVLLTVTKLLRTCESIRSRVPTYSIHYLNRTFVIEVQ